MGIRTRLASLIAGKDYPFGTPSAGSRLQFFDQQMPPGFGYQSYLKAYGEVGTLFACVNVIAQGVAKVPWHLYELDSNGERTEIFQHDLIDLLNHVNPFQSRYQFFYLGTMYKLLVGEEFWQLNFNGKDQPGEIWLAPPAYMAVIPDPVDYIAGYEFMRTGMHKPISFTIDEIIHIKTPNPYNEYRGLSPAQALTVDIDTERYAARYQQKSFFNGARPDFVIEYPPENLPPAEIRKELMQEWDERHKGWRNSQKPAFMWGGKINTLSISNKDLDYVALRTRGRDAIMEAYHVSKSKLGISEHVNRANAEQGDYDFQQNCVHPELCEIRESVNKELCPFFGDNLYLDFDNPVPEDTAANVNKAVTIFSKSLCSRNEARALLNLDPLPDGDPRGDEYAPLPTVGAGAGGAVSLSEPAPTELPKMLLGGGSKAFLATKSTKRLTGRATLTALRLTRPQ